MPKLVVTPLSAVSEAIRRHRPSRLITLLSPEEMIETPRELSPASHLRLGMNDVSESWAGEAPPSDQHVRALLAFAEGWDTKAPMLIHCWAGISRSMAAAFIVLCARHRPGRELDVARSIRARAPHASPNSLFVRLADGELARDGRMVRAIEAIGRGTIALEGPEVELPLALDLP